MTLEMTPQRQKVMIPDDPRIGQKLDPMYSSTINQPSFFSMENPPNKLDENHRFYPDVYPMMKSKHFFVRFSSHSSVE